MFGPSDMYGDLSAEDVEEFEGLEPDDEREIAPEGRFQRGELRSFDRDFEFELDSDFDENGNELEELSDFDIIDAGELELSEYVREAE